MTAQKAASKGMSEARGVLNVLLNVQLGYFITQSFQAWTALVLTTTLATTKRKYA